MDINENMTYYNKQMIIYLLIDRQLKTNQQST